MIELESILTNMHAHSQSRRNTITRLQYMYVRPDHEQ